MSVSRSGRRALLLTVIASALAAGCLYPALARAASAGTERPGQLGTVQPDKFGGLDCNGLSPIQHPVRTDLACADLHDSAYRDDRFWDNGRYVGHDEPDLNFISSLAGSGNDVAWTFTLGTDPAAAPTDAKPGGDVSHWFELTPAVWFSMPICDPQSYPLLPCTPDSDSNAPSGLYPGGGSAFLEMQFYPPGFGPWVDAPSFDNTHWGAALTIDSPSRRRTGSRTSIRTARSRPTSRSSRPTGCPRVRRAPSCRIWRRARPTHTRC